MCIAGHRISQTQSKTQATASQEVQGVADGKESMRKLPFAKYALDSILLHQHAAVRSYALDNKPRRVLSQQPQLYMPQGDRRDELSYTAELQKSLLSAGLLSSESHKDGPEWNRVQKGPRGMQHGNHHLTRFTLALAVRRIDVLHFLGQRSAEQTRARADPGGASRSLATTF